MEKKVEAILEFDKIKKQTHRICFFVTGGASDFGTRSSN